jgi:proteasome lid subunit RPN8/RPN11
MSPMRWILPTDLLAKSIRFMQPHGALGNEGLVLWFGRKIAQDAVEVTHAIEPQGSGITRSPLHLSLSLRAMNKLTNLGESIDRYLVGQIHSHPENYIDLSPVDRARGIRVPDYLSVVSPHYAQDPLTNWENCGWHEFTQGRYRRLSPREASRRIVLSRQSAIALHVEVSRD